MARTHSFSTNRYGVNSFVVSTIAANGDYTTLAGAMSDAVSGDTIFLRDSVTESVTLTAGVNIAAWIGGTLNTPSITGTLTMTTAGTCNISGIRLVTNSAALLAVTGSAASIVNLNNCYLNCTNNTGITFSTSNASGAINITDCKGDLGTTGIGLFTHTSTGTITMLNSMFTNTGASTTTSTASAGGFNTVNSRFQSPITLSSTNASTWEYSIISTSPQNATCATLGGSSHSCKWCRFDSGSASAVSIGSSAATMEMCTISSTNTNAITGAGTINYGLLEFNGTSNLINTTTQTALVNRFGIQISTLQPAFLAFSSSQLNVTGDNTNYIIGFSTEIFDQNNNFDGTASFTAPITGRYQLNADIIFNDVGVAHTACIMTITTSNRAYYFNYFNIGIANAGGVQFGVQSVLADMDAADTAFVTVQIGGGTKVVDINVLSNFAGFLVC